MRTKLVYSAPVGVFDSLGDPVADPTILEALADISIPEASALEYLYTELPNQAEFRGGYLRLALDGKRLCVHIEIDSPRKLTRSELAAVRADMDGQVFDGIGESGFDFIEEDAGVAVQTFPEVGGGKSTLVQTTGESWRPGKRSTEEAANRRRCRAAATAVNAAERQRESKKGAKPDPRKLFRLLQQEDRAGVAAEIARLGALSFIKSGQLPYELLHNRALLRLLLDAGLNPNLHDRDGHSLLWLAVGNEACVTLLLDRGADVNLRNTEVYEETALMHAAWLGDIKSVRVLLARGADPTLKTRFGNTARDEAKGGYASNKAAVVRVLTAAMQKRK